MYVFFTLCNVLLSNVAFLSFGFFVSFSTKLIVAALLFGQEGKKDEPPSKFTELSANL